MDARAENLKGRTRAFLLKVLEFADTIPTRIGATTIANQLVRSGAGVAGNYRASCRARSHAEFTARTGVVLEETDEVELWLDIANERNWGNVPLRSWLLQESRELRAIFSRSYQTAKLNEAARLAARRRER
jgi:four helix bundle protein